MTQRLVFCEKLKKELPGLMNPPFPGALGEKIYAHISQEAWTAWLKQQTILINEQRLNALDSKARAFLKEEMQKFLFS